MNQNEKDKLIEVRAYMAALKDVKEALSGYDDVKIPRFLRGPIQRLQEDINTLQWNERNIINKELGL